MRAAVVRLSIAAALITGLGQLAYFTLGAGQNEQVDPPVPVHEVRRAFADESWLPQETAAQPEIQQVESLGRPNYLGGPDDFGQIVSLRDVGGYLFVGDDLMSPHVAVIDLRTSAIVERFARNGRGPGEVLSVGHLLRGEPESVDGRELVSVWVHDFTRRRLLHAVLKEDGIAVTKEMPLAVATSAENPIRLDDGWVAGGLYGDEAVLMFFDDSGMPRAKVGRPPYSLKEIGHGTGTRLLNRNTVTASPTQDRFAAAFYSYNRIDIYDARGRLLRSVTGPRDIKTKFHITSGRFFWDEGNELAYLSITANSEFILALFCGCPLGGDEQNSRKVFHAWTWDGEFAGEYTFGGAAVYPIVMSEDGTQLFGAVEDPYPRVAVWDLPDELQQRR